MKAGDKWNWALVTSGIILTAFRFLMPMRRMQLDAMGQGTGDHLAYGISYVFTPFVLVPVMLIGAGVAAVVLRSRTPLIGALIGVAVSIPLLLMSSVAIAFARSLAPIPQAVSGLVLPVAILTWGLVRSPRNRKTSSPQPSPDSRSAYVNLSEETRAKAPWSIITIRSLLIIIMTLSVFLGASFVWLANNIPQSDWWRIFRNTVVERLGEDSAKVCADLSIPLFLASLALFFSNTKRLLGLRITLVIYALFYISGTGIVVPIFLLLLTFTKTARAFMKKPIPPTPSSLFHSSQAP